MKPNPGGVLTGENIIDRENDINELWNHLENQSVTLFSERRVGKTCLLRKLEEKPQNGWKPILYFVEGKSHPIEFVESLFLEMLNRKMVENKFYKLKTFYKKYIGGEQILSWSLPQIKENWKTLLEGLIEDIVQANGKVLFMIDELPLMIMKVIKNKDAGPLVAMDFLDSLRELRQKFEPTKKVAFIFSGSIGINLILNHLRQAYDYMGEPIYGMWKKNLVGMDNEGAIKLCKALTDGAPFKVDSENILLHIGKSVDNLPFYIHLIIQKFYDLKYAKIDKKIVDEVINLLINDPLDSGCFIHYVDRILSYYQEDDKMLAMSILSYLSFKKDFIGEDEIKESISKEMELDDLNFHHLMNLLFEDHYLIRKISNGKRYYKFKYEILRKWWEINRGKK